MNDQLQEELRRIQQILQTSDSPVAREQLSILLGQLAEQIENLRRRQEWLRRQQVEADRRLLAIESSRFFRLLRLPGRLLLDWRGRLGQKLLRSPLHPLYLKVVRPRAALDRYQLWLRNESVPETKTLTRRPLLSIVMPVCEPPHQWLEAAVKSVQAQIWPCWQLCVCDDGSTDPWVGDYLTSTAAADPRIRLTRLDKREGISAATNRAGALAEGEYVCFLDQDDLLAPHALYCVADAVEDGWPDLLYTDEDHLEGDRRVQPVFKPAYSPDLLRSCMYMAHLLVVRRRKLDEIGWLRPAYDGGQDYDLALRVTRTSRAVRHIPRILYHWRRHPESTAASSSAKPFTHEAGRQALLADVSAIDAQAVVESGPIPNSYRVRWSVPPATPVSVIICSRNPKLLKHCIEAVEKNTSHSPLEIVVVRHETGDLLAWEGLRLPREPVWLAYRGPFNFSRMNNLGAKRASGAVLVFINDDIEPLVPEWLTDLTAHALRPEIGVVGAKLLYPSGAIQHAGMVTGILSGVGHLHRDTFATEFWNWLPFARNVSAVTGACMAVRRNVFEGLNGFDEALPVNFNDVDLCLRARQAGYEVIIEPNAVLRHFECKTRAPGIGIEERELWEERWSEWLQRPDPYYNPNLSSASEAVSLGEVSGELTPRP